MRKLLTLITVLMACAMVGRAQVVTTEPAMVQQDSKDIVITFHANEGNQGLMGVTSSTKVYAHTGVITNLSTSGSDWKYAPTWGNNAAKYEMKYVSANTWTLTIPSIKEYYGITNPDEVVEKLAFVFRTANNSKEGKDKGGADIFVNVYPDGFQMQFTANPAGPVINSDDPVEFTVNTTEAADIEIYYNSTSNSIGSAKHVTTLSASQAFTTEGEYKVYAVAKAGDKTLTEEIDLVRVGETVEAPYPGGTPKMGTVRNDDGSVTFCIAAPKKTSMLLRGSWDNYGVHAMKKQTVNDMPYYWTTVSGLEDGKDYIYFYVVEGTKAVGDPYANLVLDPWNDQWISAEVFPDMPKYPSEVVSGTPVAVYNSKMNDYNWEVTDFKGVAQSDLIIYELLIRDFTGTEGQAKGEGTIAGVMDKLDYLQELGVNAIEFMPIMEFNGNNSWGYNTNFYMAPDKAYGTPDDYRQLFDEIHKRGMAVILDIVFNQTDGLHPWYMMYDIKDNPFYNGTAPHAYSVLNDWNQDNPLVQQQFKDALAYWLKEYKVDGFRFDLVKGLGENSSYGATYNASTNTWTGVTDAKTNAYNATRVARMKELHTAMKAVNPDAYFINENLAGEKEENEMAEDGETNWANVNYNSIQFAKGATSSNSLNRFYAPDDSRTWGSTVSYAESHDEQRLAYEAINSGVQGVKTNWKVVCRRLGSVAAQMLLTPGAHMIWQFQELAADQSTKTGSGNNTDPKKVIWNNLNDENKAGLHQSYVELCNLRKDNPEMFREDVTTQISLSANNGRYVSLKKDSKELYLVVNPSTSSTLNVKPGVNLSDAKYKLLSASYGTTPSVTNAGVSLEPGCYAVYGTGDILAVEDIISDADSEAPAEYYNLNGMQVNAESLVPGIYIKRQGTQASKIYVK